MIESTDNNAFDVIVMGAGWSGLMACKYSLAAGLKTVLLEARSTIGGVWAYTDDPAHGGVMKVTRTTSSRCLTEISDFPMPAAYPDFPSHGEILAYLKAYCAEFKLDDHIQLGCQIQSVKKNGDRWHVITADGRQFTSAKIICCCGVHQHPNEVADTPRFQNFTGEIRHSAAIKDSPVEHSGNTVLVWGGGESASDIASEASKVADRVYWAIPNGQWFVPRMVRRWPPFVSKRRKVLDHVTSRVRLFLSPTHRYSPLITQYLVYMLGFNGHGQEPWRTDAAYNRSFFNKSSEVLMRVKSGHIVPKRDVDHCEHDTVYFTDGTSAKVQLIITCSGYQTVMPFFQPPAAPQADPQSWYKYIFWNDDPSVASVGFVRPIIGSIPGIAEMQARYVASVFAGQSPLPSRQQRDQTIQSDSARWNRHFRYTSRRLRGLVDHFVYCDQLAELLGCRPRFFSLFFASPRKWWIAVSSPWNGCQFWLNQPAHHERIFNTYARYRDNQMIEVYIFLLMAPFLPLIVLYTYIRIFIRETLLGIKPMAAQQDMKADMSAANHLRSAAQMAVDSAIVPAAEPGI